MVKDIYGASLTLIPQGESWKTLIQQQHLRIVYYQHFVLATDVVNIDATFTGAVLMLRCMRMIARYEGRLSKNATDLFTPPYERS